MSRTTVAAPALTNPAELLYLVARLNTASLIVSLDDYPDASFAISPQDLCILEVILHCLQMSDQGHAPLFRGTRQSSERAPKISYTILITLLNFINPAVASFLMRRLAQGVSVSQNIPLTEILQNPLAVSVNFLRSDDYVFFTATSFFDFNLQALPCLLNASLNADLKTVRRIFEKTSPDMLRRLLSIEHGTGTATTRLGRITVERTGTALQMAIFDHDEEMVALFKEKMDPEEFDRQSKDAFKKALPLEKCTELNSRNASALEYHQAMLEQQNKDAEKLCAGLEDAFKAARPREFTVDDHCAASTTSVQCLRTTDAFITRLTDYVKNNPVHNPYILLRVYEIYSRLPSDFNRDSYFSQKVIGGVQSFLSARWLQHYAQGIDCLAENNEVPRRSFICRNFRPHIDIRSLVGSCIGRDSFLSIFARANGAAVTGVAGLGTRSCRQGGLAPHYENYVGQKQQAFRTLYSELQSTNSCAIQ